MSSRVDIAGIRIDCLDIRQAVDRIVGDARQGRGGWVATPNVDILRRAAHDPELASILSSATLRVADGMPLVWASRLMRRPLPERLAMSELIVPLAQAASTEGLGFFLLGDRPEVSWSAARALQRAAPTLSIVGRCTPPWGFEEDGGQLADIAKAIDDARPQVVVCALGCPKQERLIAFLAPRFPDIWFLAAGATLSMLSGHTPPAPAWMRRAGLEWLHRMRIEPGRLWTRYLVHDGPFVLRLLVRSALRGATGD